MNELLKRAYVQRPTVIVELPLVKGSRIPNADTVIIKIDNRFQDIGAFCYASRDNKRREKGQPREVVMDSFLKHRPRQILQLLKVLSRLLKDGGVRTHTACAHIAQFKLFIDWSDAKGRYDCLSGGDATRQDFLAWTENVLERYRRQEIGSGAYNKAIRSVSELLEAITGLEHLARGICSVKCDVILNGTEPLAQHDFADAVALNNALFDGLCDLVLDKRSFPYKLQLPVTLGWAENHLWLFPTNLWYLPPHLWGGEREKRTYACWAYDYAKGCLSDARDIAHRYSYWRFPSEQVAIARKLIARAQARIDESNADMRDFMRIHLGRVAHDAFLFLFFCNTGANGSVVREIETTGEIDSKTSNQKFRSIKFRAMGKVVTIVVPASFMPSLRRFMVLRQFLLGTKSCPFLFFSTGSQYGKGAPAQISHDLACSLNGRLLCRIDPMLPRMGPRKLRASVAEWYQRHHDASISAKILQNTEQATRKHYDAGSAIDHREELSQFLNAVSESAKRQRVVSSKAAEGWPSLEEGGRCDSFGSPVALADGVPVTPNCKDSQGCLFCAHRVLVACEEDVRKVASAAFVMEQVILGPQHENALRPLIIKCDEDIENIAARGDRAMVTKVCNDVYENGNLTSFFSDKYRLFLELGIIV